MLTCSGLVEAVRVSRAGFPVRMPHQHLINRFSLLLPTPRGNPNAKDVARQVLGLLVLLVQKYKY
jgi:myosin heavy subunit